jgi:hypothetical protein
LALSPSQLKGAANRPVLRVVIFPVGARWGRADGVKLSTRCAALDWNGEVPVPHGRQ